MAKTLIVGEISKGGLRESTLELVTLARKLGGDVGLSAAAIAPKVKIEKIYSPPKGKGAEILTGSKDEVAQKFVGKVKELGLL